MGWWGALAADLFPDWAHRPILNIFTWQSFTIHALIFGYVLMRLVAGDLVPDIRNLGRVAIMVVVFATIGYLANQVWDTNFWFLNVGAPGSPLEGIQVLAGTSLRARPDRPGRDPVDGDVPAVGGARPPLHGSARRAGTVGA